MRFGDLKSKNREEWGKMSRIKRDFIEKIHSLQDGENSLIPEICQNTQKQ
ncbi:hypothetical protein D1BOALGB6SA_8123 [Olavius sp. associated proteobacterium Delta 1]|nr:hypothetical protein D1BOALGB6SA_8123 [Olavius sp. associated proteobacterium Delta 1]